MANIEIVYRIGSCAFNYSAEYCPTCHTCWADEIGCRFYCSGEVEEKNGVRLIPFGNCIHAHYDYGFKGGVYKRYEMEEYTDSYNMHMNCMNVTLGGYVYECVKVTLDGKVIYNEWDEEEGGT